MAGRQLPQGFAPRPRTGRVGLPTRPRRPCANFRFASFATENVCNGRALTELRGGPLTPLRSFPDGPGGTHTSSQMRGQSRPPVKQTAPGASSIIGLGRRILINHAMLVGETTHDPNRT